VGETNERQAHVYKVILPLSVDFRDSEPSGFSLSPPKNLLSSRLPLSDPSVESRSTNFLSPSQTGAYPLLPSAHFPVMKSCFTPCAFPFRDADPTCPSRICSGGAIRFRVPGDHNYPVKENLPCFRLVEPNYIHTSVTKAPFQEVSTLCTGLPIRVRVVRRNPQFIYKPSPGACSDNA
jgi:hypothetical protein